MKLLIGKPNDRQPDQVENVFHRALASPDSALLASQMEFAIGTTSNSSDWV